MFQAVSTCVSPYSGVRSGGGGGGASMGLIHIPLMQSFTLGSAKIEFLETYFFDIVITRNDHPRYCKACFRPYMCICRILGVCCLG